MLREAITLKPSFRMVAAFLATEVHYLYNIQSTLIRKPRLFAQLNFSL